MNLTACPQCGHNFAADAPVEAHDWRIDPRAGRASWRGVAIPVRTQWIRLLHTVAVAAPNIVKAEAILNRISSSELPNTVQVMLSQMKRQWPAQVPWPIENVYGHGYRWNGGAL